MNYLKDRMLFEANQHPPFPTWQDYLRWGVIKIKDGKDDGKTAALRAPAKGDLENAR